MIKGENVYEKAARDQAPENISKYATDALEKFQKAREFAHYIGFENKVGVIDEYISLCIGLNGNAHLQMEKYEEAKNLLQQALKLNSKTLKSDTQLLRRNLFTLDLVHTSLKLQLPIEAERYALRILKATDKLDIVEKKFTYYKEIKDVFLELNNFKGYQKSIAKIIKLLKKYPKIWPDKQELAEIYLEYGNFLLERVKNKENAQKFYQKALKLYENAQNDEKIKLIQEKLNL